MTSMRLATPAMPAAALNRGNRSLGFLRAHSRPVRRIAALLLLCALACAEERFQPLFNGRNLDDFVVDTLGVWRVENGIIIGSTPNGLRYNDFLRTKKHYSDFVLKLRFRLKGGVGNSGIQFRSKPVENSHEVSGYQADIGQQYWGALYDESRRKKVLAGPTAAQLAHLDKEGWNEYVITARGRHITLELNGVRTVDYREPDPNIEPAGFIALQVHGGPPTQVEFKDLRIQVLQ